MREDEPPNAGRRGGAVHDTQLGSPLPQLLQGLDGDLRKLAHRLHDPARGTRGKGTRHTAHGTRHTAHDEIGDGRTNLSLGAPAVK